MNHQSRDPPRSRRAGRGHRVLHPGVQGGLAASLAQNFGLQPLIGKPHAVVDDTLSPDFPLGDSLEVFIRREDAERFIEVRGDDPEVAAKPRIEECERRRAELAPTGHGDQACEFSFRSGLFDTFISPLPSAFMT